MSLFCYPLPSLSPSILSPFPFSPIHSSSSLFYSVLSPSLYFTHPPNTFPFTHPLMPPIHLYSSPCVPFRFPIFPILLSPPFLSPILLSPLFLFTHPPIPYSLPYFTHPPNPPFLLPILLCHIFLFIHPPMSPIRFPISPILIYPLFASPFHPSSYVPYSLPHFPHPPNTSPPLTLLCPLFPHFASHERNVSNQPHFCLSTVIGVAPVALSAPPMKW